MLLHVMVQVHEEMETPCTYFLGALLYVVFGFNNVTLVPEGISGLRKEADCF